MVGPSCIGEALLSFSSEAGLLLRWKRSRHQGTHGYTVSDQPTAIFLGAIDACI